MEATNGLDQAKRQRLGEDVSSVPPQGTPRSILPPGPISIAQLFTLTQDPGPQVFDVHAIPFELVNKILVPILSSIDQTNLDNAVNVCVPLEPNMHSTPEDLLTGSCQPNFACYLLITSIGCSYPILVSEPAPAHIENGCSETGHRIRYCGGRPTHHGKCRIKSQACGQWTVPRFRSKSTIGGCAGPLCNPSTSSFDRRRSRRM